MLRGIGCGNSADRSHAIHVRVAHWAVTGHLYRQASLADKRLEWTASSAQDHRSVKRVTRPMLRFKSFEAAQGTLAGIELMHMLRKGQLVGEEGAEGLTPVEQFYA